MKYTNNTKQAVAVNLLIHCRVNIFLLRDFSISGDASPFAGATSGLFDAMSLLFFLMEIYVFIFIKISYRNESWQIPVQNESKFIHAKDVKRSQHYI